MKKYFAAFLACLMAVGLAVPAALGEEINVSFETAALTYDSGSETALAFVASAAPESDLLLTVTDNRKNTYTVVLPAGQTRTEMPVASAASANGSKTVYTLQKGEGYARKAPYECAVTARAATVYSFANAVYQTYEGRDLTFKIRVANPDRLAADTQVTVRDEDGNVLETISHNPRRTGAYSFTYKADGSWRPGKTLSVWVDGREQADSSALMAVGVTGTKSIYGVRRDDNRISFTMDCGSGADNLPYILDTLDQFGLKITFFVTGKFAEKNPDMVREMAARGHEIGNHSWSHPSFYELTPEEMLSQLSRTSDLVEELTGKPTVLFRPPEGNCNSKIRAIVNAAGYEVIRWTHESYDARKEASQERSLKFSTKDMKGGSIILTHIDADCTVAVLPQILQWYQDNGFEVVPVGQLIYHGNTATDENGLQYLID